MANIWLTKVVVQTNPTERSKSKSTQYYSLNPEIERKIQDIISETFQDVESEWISYFQHKSDQLHLDKKSFFIGMMYPKITKNLENNNIHIRIKSDSWGD